MATFELKTWELLCYCFIFVTGLIGNLAVCLVVLKSEPSNRRFYHIPFNFYLMSLAIVDLALSVICLPVYVMSTSSFGSHPNGTAGDVLCRTLTGYLLCFLLAGVSVYLMVIISFERYTAICKPFHAMTRKASKKTSVYIAGAWCVGFLIQLPSIITITYRDSVNATVGAHCGYTEKNTLGHEIVYAILLILQYGVPAVIVVVNFYRIQNCLTQLSGTLKRSFGDTRLLAQIMKAKRKTVRIVFVVSAAFFICWTPNTVTFMIFQYGHRFGAKMTYDNTYYQVGMVLAFLSSCINPFLYAFQSDVFRSHSKKVFKKIFGRMLPGRCPIRKGLRPKIHRINSSGWQENHQGNGYERIA